MPDNIYFRDKNNDLKGPFTERQIQEWYRSGWFDGHFLFYFMEGSEKPSSGTTAITMSDLRASYGVGCPFGMARENEEKMEERRKKIAAYDQDLERLREGAYAIKVMEARMDAVETALKSLQGADAAEVAKKEKNKKKKEEEEAPPPAAAAAPPVESSRPKRKTNASGRNSDGVPDWVDQFTDFFLANYEALREGVNPVSKWLDPKEMEITQIRCGHVQQHPPSVKLLLHALVKAIAEKKFLYCAPCRQVLQSWRLAMLHLTNPEHEAKAVRLFPIWGELTDLLVDFFNINLATKWLNEEHAKFTALSKRFAGVPINAPHLRPTIEFAARVQQQYAPTIFPGGTQQLPLSKIDHAMELITGDLGVQIMTELHEHLKDAQTRCLACRVVVGSAAEYYAHLVGSGHMKMANSLDLLTLVVNAHRKEPMLSQ